MPANSLDDVLKLLDERGEEAKILAGGQSLIPLMKLRIARPALVVDINRVKGLNYMNMEDGSLKIGALVRIAQLERTKFPSQYDILRAASRQVADPQVRNMGTVGGNAAHGDPGNDLPAVFISLKSKYVVKSKRGTREIPAKDFYKGPFTTELRPDEVLVEVNVPHWDGYSGGTYLKFERRTGDYAIAAVAVQLTVDDDNRVTRAGVAFTNAGPTPLPAEEIEESIIDKRGLENLLTSAKNAFDKMKVNPVSDLRGPDWYKRDVMRVLLLRGIKTVYERLVR
ncbi:MAG: xanthine dehydrogenase family protein subunit M [Nitrososphaerota archaeon]